MSGNGKEGKNGKIIIIVGAIVIIALLGIIIFLLGSGKQDEEETQEKRNVIVNESNAESVAADMVEEAQEFVEPGYNLIENTNDVYFDVLLVDNEEEAIYQSPVIPRGSHLEKIELDKPLDKGTYDCVIVYHLVDEEQETISTLRVAFTITVDS